MLPLITTIAALLLAALVLQDAFEVMLLPRRVDRRYRLARIYFRTAWTLWRSTARLTRPDQHRIRFLGTFGPLSMVMLFTLWVGLLILSFGALGWVCQGHVHPHSPLSEQVYLSGVTFFTLGYGDIVPHSGLARVVAVIEAGTGLGFIAVVIGYLPVLYQLFAGRESHVIQLDTRAGSPPTATTMLVLHAELDGLVELNALLAEWENWGAELLESHLSYPMLVFYRSQHDDQSWLAAMTAVMDVCAIILVGLEDMPVLQARMTFTMCRGVIVEMCRALRVRPSPYDGGDRLPPAEFARLDARLREAGLRWKAGAGDAPPDAHIAETLLALRATYEPLLDGLSRFLLLPLPPFVPADTGADHWEGGPRGLIASRLVAQLSAADPLADIEPGSGGRLGQRVRRRLDRR